MLFRDFCTLPVVTSALECYLLFMKRLCLSLFLFSLFSAPLAWLPLFAQSPLLPQGDLSEQLYRILQNRGELQDPASFLLRPLIPHNSLSIETMDPLRSGFRAAAPVVDVSGVSLFLFEPVWFNSYNTTLPRGSMDGALWQGRGYNTSLSAGLFASYGPLSLTFRPRVITAENRYFDPEPYNPPEIRTGYYRGTASEFAYPGFRGRIDYPIRFGDHRFSRFDLGDSSLELRLFGFSAALSNQRLWTGPGVQNSLQFGYHAPGFLHLRLGTSQPFETRIGSFEWLYIFGGVRKSDFYSDGVYNTHSVNSMALTYSPRFIPGLSVGTLRTFFHRYPSDFSEYWDQASKLFEAAVRVGLQNEENPTGYDPDNQVWSVFARWVFPESGFEFYGEYGRNDHNVDLRDFRMQYNHHRAYILGMQKATYLYGERVLNLNFEIMQSETPRSSLTRGNQNLGGWYVHGQQVVGFTHRGQIPGTGYGPGVNMQWFAADLFSGQYRLGVHLARIVYHNSRVDQFFSSIARVNSDPVERWEVRNVELLAGVRITRPIPLRLELDAAIEQSLILNHHNIANNDLGNTRFELTVRKQIRGALR